MYIYLLIPIHYYIYTRMTILYHRNVMEDISDLKNLYNFREEYLYNESQTQDTSAVVNEASSQLTAGQDVPGDDFHQLQSFSADTSKQYATLTNYSQFAPDTSANHSGCGAAYDESAPADISHRHQQQEDIAFSDYDAETSTFNAPYQKSTPQRSNSPIEVAPVDPTTRPKLFKGYGICTVSGGGYPGRTIGDDAFSFNESVTSNDSLASDDYNSDVNAAYHKKVKTDYRRGDKINATIKSCKNWPARVSCIYASALYKRACRYIYRYH